MRKLGTNHGKSSTLCGNNHVDAPTVPPDPDEDPQDSRHENGLESGPDEQSVPPIIEGEFREITPGQAPDELSAHIVPMPTGLPVPRPPGRNLFGLWALLELYLRYHSVQGSTPATILIYRKELGLFLRFPDARGHSMDPTEVATIDVLDQLEDLKARGRTARTLRTRRQMILTFFNWAKAQGVVGTNPVGGIKPAKVPKRAKPLLPPEDFQKLLDMCPVETFTGARRQAMLWLMLESGVRKRELSNLNLEDLDWEIGLVRMVNGKGQKDRIAPFGASAQLPMLRYLAFRKDSHLCLWVTEEFTPLGYEGIGSDIGRLRDYAGLRGSMEDVFHIFRRTAAANAEEAGVSPSHIMAAFGWDDPAMLNHYVAARRMEKGKAIESFKDKNPLGTWLGA